MSNVDVFVEILPIPVVQTEVVTGPAGPAAQWVRLTQAEFDALPVKNQNTLYVIIG